MQLGNIRVTLTPAKREELRRFYAQQQSRALAKRAAILSLPDSAFPKYSRDDELTRRDSLVRVQRELNAANEGLARLRA